MGKRTWSVEPEVIRIDLSGGDWIEIKKNLTVGEEKRIYGSTFSKGQLGGGGIGVEMDLASYDLRKVEAYLLAWSAKDKDDKPIDVSYDAICALPSDVFDEILAAIDKHTDAMEQEKKAKTGSRKLAAISR